MDRYTFMPTPDSIGFMVEDEDGYWVKYSDVESLQARVRELEGMVRSAFDDGFQMGWSNYSPVEGNMYKNAGDAYKHSDTRDQLESEMKQAKGTP